MAPQINPYVQSPNFMNARYLGWCTADPDLQKSFTQISSTTGRHSSHAKGTRYPVVRGALRRLNVLD
jgi:hypothetical protein